MSKIKLINANEAIEELRGLERSLRSAHDYATAYGVKQCCEIISEMPEYSIKRGDSPAAHTGGKFLPPCGCGEEAVRDEMIMRCSGKDVLMHSIRCPNGHVCTQDYANEEDAEKAWKLAMGAGMIIK